MRRETLGGVLLGASLLAAIAFEAAGIHYGWGVMAAVLAFIAGCLMLSS